jgi:hypothetical protein
MHPAAGRREQLTDEVTRRAYVAGFAVRSSLGRPTGRRSRAKASPATPAANPSREVSSHGREEKVRGMALVFVILVALLVGGVFSGIAAVNYIEILRSRAEDNGRMAKDCALFGLGMAVEKLQRLAGVDRYATANGDMMAAVDGDDCHCTGVWAVEGDGLDRTTKFLGWLRSGDDDFTDGGDGDRISVFSTAEGGTVTVPAIRMKADGGAGGRYGFWISDESQKIKINAVDRHSTAADGRAKKIRCHCPQTFDTTSIAEGVALGNVPILEKLDFPEQLAFVDGIPFASLLSNGHRITLHSHGVLSSARDGGLRRDLSSLAAAMAGGVG